LFSSVSTVSDFRQKFIHSDDEIETAEEWRKAQPEA
jgi:hypothetical protein